MTDQTYQSLKKEWLAQVNSVPAFKEFVAFMEPEESCMAFGLDSLRLVWVTHLSQADYHIKSLIFRNPVQRFDTKEIKTSNIFADFKSCASESLEYVARNLSTLSNQSGPFNARN